MRRRLLPLLALCAAVPAAAQTAWVLTSDFTSGSLARVNSATRAVSDNVNSVHGDARLRVVNDTVYVVNRFGADNVQVVHPATGATIRDRPSWWRTAITSPRAGRATCIRSQPPSRAYCLRRQGPHDPRALPPKCADPMKARRALMASGDDSRETG